MGPCRPDVRNQSDMLCLRSDYTGDFLTPNLVFTLFSPSAVVGEEDTALASAAHPHSFGTRT